MSNAPLMPKATAIWLIENTALTFEQIAEFCELHPLTVKSLANDEYITKLQPQDPIAAGYLTREEIERCTQNAQAVLKSSLPPLPKKAGGKRQATYVPIVKRQEKPRAIRWLLENYPDIKDSVIIRLIGTTKNTIMSLRDGTHWNYSETKAADPVMLGLCSQSELTTAVLPYKKRTALPTENETTIDQKYDGIPQVSMATKEHTLENQEDAISQAEALFRNNSDNES